MLAIPSFTDLMEVSAGDRKLLLSTLDYLGRCPALHGAVPGLERPVLAQLVVEEELLVVEGARGDEHLRRNSELGLPAPTLNAYSHTYILTD